MSPLFFVSLRPIIWNFLSKWMWKKQIYVFDLDETLVSGRIQCLNQVKRRKSGFSLYSNRECFTINPEKMRVLLEKILKNGDGIAIATNALVTQIAVYSFLEREFKIEIMVMG